MGDEDSMSCYHIPYPPSQHEKWKKARQRPNGDFNSYASRAVVEKIISWIYCAYGFLYVI